MTYLAGNVEIEQQGRDDFPPPIGLVFQPAIPPAPKKFNFWREEFLSALVAPIGSVAGEGSDGDGLVEIIGTSEWLR